MHFSVIVQYGRSFEHLEKYARDPGRLHWPASGALDSARGRLGG